MSSNALQTLTTCKLQSFCEDVEQALFENQIGGFSQDKDIAVTFGCNAAVYPTLVLLKLLMSIAEKGSVNALTKGDKIVLEDYPLVVHRRFLLSGYDSVSACGRCFISTCVAFWKLPQKGAFAKRLTIPKVQELIPDLCRPGVSKLRKKKIERMIEIMQHFVQLVDWVPEVFTIDSNVRKDYDRMMSKHAQLLVRLLSEGDVDGNEVNELTADFTEWLEADFIGLIDPQKVAILVFTSHPESALFLLHRESYTRQLKHGWGALRGSNIVGEFLSSYDRLPKKLQKLQLTPSVKHRYRSSTTDEIVDDVYCESYTRKTIEKLFGATGCNSMVHHSSHFFPLFPAEETQSTVDKFREAHSQLINQSLLCANVKPILQAIQSKSPIMYELIKNLDISFCESKEICERANKRESLRFLFEERNDFIAAIDYDISEASLINNCGGDVRRQTPSSATSSSSSSIVPRPFSPLPTKLSDRNTVESNSIGKKRSSESDDEGVVRSRKFARDSETNAMEEEDDDDERDRFSDTEALLPSSVKLQQELQANDEEEDNEDLSSVVENQEDSSDESERGDSKGDDQGSVEDVTTIMEAHSLYQALPPPPPTRSVLLHQPLPMINTYQPLPVKLEQGTYQSLSSSAGRNNKSSSISSSYSSPFASSGSFAHQQVDSVLKFVTPPLVVQPNIMFTLVYVDVGITAVQQAIPVDGSDKLKYLWGLVGGNNKSMRDSFNTAFIARYNHLNSKHKVSPEKVAFFLDSLMAALSLVCSCTCDTSTKKQKKGCLKDLVLCMNQSAVDGLQKSLDLICYFSQIFFASAAEEGQELTANDAKNILTVDARCSWDANINVTVSTKSIVNREPGIRLQNKQRVELSHEDVTFIEWCEANRLANCSNNKLIDKTTLLSCLQELKNGNKKNMPDGRLFSQSHRQVVEKLKSNLRPAGTAIVGALHDRWNDISRSSSIRDLVPPLFLTQLSAHFENE